MKRIRKIFILPLVLLVALLAIPAIDVLQSTSIAGACASFPTLINAQFQDNNENTVNYVSSNTANRTYFMTARNDTCTTYDVKIQGYSTFTPIRPYQAYAYGYDGATVSSCSFVWEPSGKAWCYVTMPPGSEVDMFIAIQVQTTTDVCYNGCKSYFGETWWTGHGVKWYTNQEFYSVHN